VQVFAEKLQGIHRASLEAAVAPVLSSHGVDTAEISYQMEPTGWVLRVIVEALEKAADDEAKADAARAAEAEANENLVFEGPIDLGLLSEISRDLSAALDVADIIPHRYSLEVSSPGLERPLRTARDFKRAVGRLAKVRLIAPAPDGQRVLRGNILSTSDDSISMDVDGNTVVTSLGNVERAHLIFELPAHPKRGHAKPGKQKRH
jgi:ribosome maturation factor RimP